METAETPAKLGFYMPAEWQGHHAVWLAWPYDSTTFPDRVEKVEKRYIEIIKAIHLTEQVELLVLDQAAKKKVTVGLLAAGINIEKINFHIADYADVWTRDYAPLFLTNDKALSNDAAKKLGWVKWKYNAYGKNNDRYFTDLLKDNEVFNTITPAGQKFIANMVLEGGSVEVNGEGTLITTEQCLLNPNRNPELNKEQIEKYLKDYLGASKIIWLKKGLINDHTDGHIDDIARFVAPGKILCCYEENPNDENYETLKENYETLLKATDQNGRDFEIIKMPMPDMNYDDGSKAPVSYVNFYIGNGAILAGTFNDKNDQKALDILQSLFPDRKIIGIDCTDIIYGGGGIHCITQQQPKA